MSGFDPYAHLGVIPNDDGTVTRLTKTPTTEPNPEALPGQTTVSKDLTLNAENKTWVRIYRPTKLPSNDNTVVRLPIIIYFRGGSFVLYSAGDQFVHQNCCHMASEFPAIVVSVNYRLAPESRLPAQYDDALDAMLWVKRQALHPEGEPWIKNFGDFSRCYLGGRGNGGNIVFHAALRALDLDLEPLMLSGLLLNQPMFGGVQRLKSEVNFAADQLLPLPVLDAMWEMALPKGMDRDHRFCNPMIDGAYKCKMGSLPRCLVFGFGWDPMVDRQQEFVKMLVESGVQVEAHFDDVGFHGIDIVDHRRAMALLKIIQDFIF